MNDLKQVRFERKQILPSKVALQVFRHMKNIETLSMPLKDIEVDVMKDGESFGFNWKYGQISNQFKFQTEVDVSIEGYDLSKIIRQKDSIDEIINLKGYKDLLRASLKPGKYSQNDAFLIVVKKSDPIFKSWKAWHIKQETPDSSIFELKARLKDSLQMILDVIQLTEVSGKYRVLILLNDSGTVRKVTIKQISNNIKMKSNEDKLRHFIMSQFNQVYSFLGLGNIPLPRSLEVCFLIEFKDQAKVLGFW